jgi:hypothetical protein
MAKIMGNIVGLPSPRSDWNQTDEMKADFIKNKPVEAINAVNNLKYYGDANIVPSYENWFLFVNSNEKEVAISTDFRILAQSGFSGDLTIPYNSKKNPDKIVTKIAEEAFKITVGLNKVIIPNSIKVIGEEAFKTSGVKEIVFCGKPSEINTNAFEDCMWLKDVYFKGSKAEWDAIEIGEGNEALLNATIHFDYTNVTKSYVDEKIGDIEAALDELHNYAQALINGGGA